MIRYCERDTTGWFAEPLNTVSGLAYLVSAWQVWKHLDRGSLREQWDLHLLAGLIALVGVAGMLWHGSGLDWLWWVDAGVIVAFVATYWSAFLVRTQGLGVAGLILAWIATGIALLGMATLAHRVPLETFGGTVPYVPMFVLLLAGMVLAARVDRRLARDLLLASLIFLAALVVRALDQMLCEWVVVGTHWIWHLLTAGVLYVLVDGLIRNVQASEVRTANRSG